MSLSERLSQADGAASQRDAAISEKNKAEMIRSLQYLIIEEMGDELAEGEAGADVRAKIERRLLARLANDATPLSTSDRFDVVQSVIDNILGYGPIQAYLQDPGVTEVMVNGPHTVYVERDGKLLPTPARFIDEQHLLRLIDKIASEVGRRIDESSPMVDARLPDGSRVNAIIHPLALNGPMLTVRKFSAEPFEVEDLIGFGTLTPGLAQLMDMAVKGKLNILITGGTGTGKTTLLNVVSQSIPSDERIITIEDSAELRLHQRHVLRLESRPANIEGKGEVTIRDLVRNSLRMRPDRIVVGEVRGGEALDMLQAMNTGHEGSLSTIHANSPRDALSRLETMVLMAGYDLPLAAIRQQAGSAIDLIVQLSRLRDGTRRVTSVVEVSGMEGDNIVLEEIFAFDYSPGIGADGRVLGFVRPTGIRPKFCEKLSRYGIHISSAAFDPNGTWEG